MCRTHSPSEQNKQTKKQQLSNTISAAVPVTSPAGHLTGRPAVESAQLPEAISAPAHHSLVQMADDIFEDLIILPGKTSQDILHRLKALLPVVDFWIIGTGRREVTEEGARAAERKD